MNWLKKASDLSETEKLASIEKFNEEMKAEVTRCVGILSKDDAAGENKMKELKALLDKIQKNVENIDTTLRNRNIQIETKPGPSGSELTEDNGKGAGFDGNPGKPGTGMPI